jgi:predicted PurR-regulated permease PerM
VVIPVDTETGEASTPWPSARVVTATVAVIFLLYFGREFFVPIAIALLLSALFRPVVRWLEQRRIPTSAGATVVVLLFIIGVGAAGFGLSVPVQSWASKVPASIKAAQSKLEGLRKPVQQLTKTAEQIQNAGQDPGKNGAQKPSQQAAEAPQGPKLIARALGTTTSILATVVTVVLLMWLLLASGDLFYEKLRKLLPAASEKRTAAKVVHDTESVISGYLVATALINLGQAAAVGLALWLLGMPDPFLWAILTFGFEFIPYLGGAVMVGLLTLVAFTTFDSLGHTLAVPGAYLGITTLQNNVVSPLVYGNRLKLNPVAVFVGVLFWWTLWGVPGAFIAVPIIAAAKILGDHVERLRAVGEFLGG